MANKLYFIKPNDWEVCHLHHWGVIQTSWPGIELQLGESGYYECDISELYTTENIENNPILYLQLNHNGQDSVFNSTETNNGEARLNDMSGRIYEVQYAELVCIGRVTEDEPDIPDEPEPEPDTPVEPTFDCGLMKHLPEYWHQNLEMQEILKRQCEEFKLYVLSQEPVFTDSFILQASEDRILEWEKKLGITGNGTLDERRQVIFGMLYSIRKLDEATIKELVRLNCSNADCNVRIKNSNIDVEVLPTSHNGYYNFANLNRVLNIKKPAHLGLKVYFYECTWGEIKKNFSTWNDVKTYGNWSDVNTYLAYLEG